MLKKFNEFNKQSKTSSYEFILKTIKNLNMIYDSDIEGGIKATKDDKVFHIFPTDDDVEWANYNVQFFLNGKEIDDFETTDLKYMLKDYINKKIY